MKILLAIFSYHGIEDDTFDSLIREVYYARKHGIDLQVVRMGNDACLDRIRSRALSLAVELAKDVIITIDRDMVWEAGNAIATAKKCFDRDALAQVGGFYSKRAKGKGMAGRLMHDQAVTIGEDLLYVAEFTAGGFTAVPVSILRRLIDNRGPYGAEGPITESRWEGGVLWDFARPFPVESRLNPGQIEYLSEDWAFSYRVRVAGFPVYLWAKPDLGHVGEYTYRMPDSIESIDPRITPGTVDSMADRGICGAVIDKVWRCHGRIGHPGSHTASERIA